MKHATIENAKSRSAREGKGYDEEKRCAHIEGVEIDETVRKGDGDAGLTLLERDNEGVIVRSSDS